MEDVTTAEGETLAQVSDDSVLPLADIILGEEDLEGAGDTTMTTASLQEGETEDTSDSISSQTGANIATSGEEKENIADGDDVDGEDESKIENESSDNIISNEDNIGSVPMEDGDLEEMEQNSNSNESTGDDPESAISITPVISDKKSFSIGDGTTAQNKSSSSSQPVSVQNGLEANTNEEKSSSSSSDENSKLSGFLGMKDSSSSPNKQQSPSQQQQTRSFSVSDGNAIAKELEEQVSKLNQLLVLKEQEWSAILRLKKHMEYALDQVKCTQKMANVQDEMNGLLSMTEIKTCMSLIKSDKDALSVAERRMEESIENAESENESLQTIFPFRSSSTAVSLSNALVAEEGTGKGDILTATAALQKLCERKRKAMDDPGPNRSTRLRYNETTVSTSQDQRKVIGNGRRGNMLDVQAIIQSHRNLGVDKSRGASKPAAKKIPFTITPDRQYVKTIEELLALAEADNKVQRESTSITNILATTTSVPQVASTRILQSNKTKNGKPAARQTTASSNSLLISNPTPSGSGTLAKMLSPSTHSSGVGAARGMNDASSNASQKFANKLPTSDASLSLANLLASSKVDSKVNIVKLKKERVREDEPSHVPSQQQADAVPICQGCNLSRAQFVCAGCANQWYCSRECQVAAWDEHSEICSG